MIGELGDRIATLVQDNLVAIPDFPEPACLRTGPRSRNLWS